MDAALLFFGLLWALLGGKSSTPETSPPPRQLPPGGGGGGPLVSTPPWPQVVPAGLPPFPGAGWEFDEPPPVAVQQRAQQLVSQLWARGSGAWKIEQTAGRWIAYQAQIVASGKKGVVAYREKRRALPPAPPSAVRRNTETAARAPTAAKPVSYQVEVGPAQIKPPPVAPAPLTTLPTLRYGMGLKPAAPVREVVLLQQRLGISADGRFGAGTREAVVSYQRSHGLGVDGVVGAETWASLFAAERA